MSTKQWVQRTAWSGLFLMSVFVAMQVEAQRGGGRGGGGGGSFSGGGGWRLFPEQWCQWRELQWWRWGRWWPRGGFSEWWGRVSCGGFFSERCRQ